MATAFEAALLRLKAVLQLQTDKEVAAALGMSATALNDRKKRDSFPVDRVKALASELHFDVDYVLFGVAQAAMEMIQAARQGRPLKKVSAEDAVLLSRWHSCSGTDQRLLLNLMNRLSAAPAENATTPDGRYPQRAESHPMALHETDPDRAAAAAAAKKSATKKR